MASLRSLLADTRPLQNLHYRRLWLANIVTVIGAQLTLVSVPAQIYADTGNSAYVGLTGLFGLVPLLVFGLWGGALADHFNHRSMLVLTTIGLVATSFGFYLLAALGNTNVWLLLSVFAVQQCFFALNQPVRTVILPQLLPAGQIPAAQSLNMTVFNAGGIAGPLVGGALIPVLGFSWLYLVDTVFLVPTLIAVLLLPDLRPGGREDGEGATRRAPGLRSVLEGFTYLAGHKVLLVSFAVDLIAMVFGMPRALFPQIAHESFGGSRDGGLAFGLLFAAIPIGAALGGLFSGWVSRVQRQGLAVIVCIVVWGASMAVLGIAVGLAGGRPGLWLWVGAGALMVGGAADMASAAFRSAMLLTAASEHVRGRLQGVFMVVVAGGPRVADMLHGALAVSLGTAVTTGAGGVLVIVGVVLCAVLVPAFVRYRVSASVLAG